MQIAIKDHQAYYAKVFHKIHQPEQVIEAVEFEDCRFVECDFTEATFKQCRFIECTFADCNLSIINLAQSHFADVGFEQCKLIGVDWTRAAWPEIRLSAALTFQRCTLSDSSFFDLGMDEIKLVECKAYEVDFRNGSFCHADFSYTDFAGSLFGKTDLSGADFSEALNYEIDIFDNKLDKAKFTRHEAVRLLSSLDIELLD